MTLHLALFEPALLAMGLRNIYLFCAIMGAGYLLIGFLLGQFSFGDHGGGHDVGGHDLAGHDAAGHPVGGHGAAGHAGPSAHGQAAPLLGVQMLGPLSPLVLAMFVGCFGLIGLATTRGVAAPGAASALPAAGVSLLVAAAMRWTINKLFSRAEVSSAPAAEEVVGLEADVITPIPRGGAGEIAFVVRGSRYNGIARVDRELEMPRGTRVVITHRDGATFYVAPARGA